MKNLKNLIAFTMAIVMILFSLTTLYSRTNAIIIYKGKELAIEEHKIGGTQIHGYSKNKYEFSPSELQEIYAYNSTNTDGGLNAYMRDRVKVSEDLIPIFRYENGKVDKNNYWSDGMIDASDATNIFCIGSLGSSSSVYNKVNEERNSKEYMDKNFREMTYSIQMSLAEYLKIKNEDVLVKATVKYPQIEGVTEKEQSVTIDTKLGFTDELYQKAFEFFDYNYKAQFGKDFGGIEDIKNMEGDIVSQQKVSISVVTPDNSEYKVVLGTDNNFYLEKTAEEKKEFSTDLSYTAISGSEKLDGKMSADGSTFLPPYYDNDNSKKDADAIATITSKTDEEIVATDGVALTNDGKANSKGWYYPNLDNKKVIAKDYPFDDYDNTKYNGIIKETVKLTGAEGGTDTQTPSIQWTFRRKTTDKKTNSDESITVTITYNLPVDPDSIPNGWEPVYDSDGQTIHKITRTFKKGEEYDKDVTVKQNGTGVTNTTHVTITWPKDNEKKEELPTVLAKTGETTKYILIAVIAGLVIFAVIRYRKLKNKR